MDEYFDLMKILIDANTSLPGGDPATLKAIKNIDQRTPVTSILDVGCGLGDFARKAGKAFPNASVVGIDINADAINKSAEIGKSFGVNFSYYFRSTSWKRIFTIKKTCRAQ
jgi:ubiquinone/menaquinone biosynthesis C-methylase UbiE